MAAWLRAWNISFGTIGSRLCGAFPRSTGQVLAAPGGCAAPRRAPRWKLCEATVGFVFQAFNLLPALTATENVSIPLLIRGMSHKQPEDLARKVLKQVGLGDRVNALPAQLSGGSNSVWQSPAHWFMSQN
jgi:predicted ABC-type transport system involved in lysophospholipase L1 biosynthesis ATPase subunit